MAPTKYGTDPWARARIKELKEEMGEIKRVYGERLDMHRKELDALKAQLEEHKHSVTVGSSHCGVTEKGGL